MYYPVIILLGDKMKRSNRQSDKTTNKRSNNMNLLDNENKSRSNKNSESNSNSSMDCK